MLPSESLLGHVTDWFIVSLCDAYKASRVSLKYHLLKSVKKVTTLKNLSQHFVSYTILAKEKGKMKATSSLHTGTLLSLLFGVTP